MGRRAGERGREVGRREVGRRAGERGRGGEERHHMTTTVPCRGVSIIYIYTVHYMTYIMYIHVQHSRVCVSVKRVCVCVHVSGCELIPERRGRREGGAGVGAGLSTTAMHVCM